MISVKKKLFIKVVKYSIVMLIAFLIAFSFKLYKYENMDFNRHAAVMDYVRNTGISYSDYLNTADGLFRNSTSKYTYTFNTVMYIFANHFSNNYTVVWFLTTIDYLFIALIAYDLKKKKQYKIREVLVAVAVCFSFLPMIHVVSGLRTANAMCIAAFGIYFLLYRDINILLFVVIVLISITVHPASLIPLFVASVIRYFPSKKLILIAFLSTLGMSIISMVFLKSGVSFLIELGDRFSLYSSETQYRSYRYPFYGAVLFSIIVLFYYIVFYSGNNTQNEIRLSKFIRYTKFDTDLFKGRSDRLFLFLAVYSALMIGNIGSYEMVNRMAYLSGALAPVYSVFLFEYRNNKNASGIALVLRMMIYFVMMIVSTLFVIHYYPYFVRRL